MDRMKVIQFLEGKKRYLFPNNKYSDIDLENALAAAPDHFERTMNSVTFKEPSTVKIISIFLGIIGIDRFYLGDIAMGLLKYFTFGGLGIWWIVDIVNAEKMCRACNCKRLIKAASDPSFAGKATRPGLDSEQAKKMAKDAVKVGSYIKTGVKDFQDSMEIH